MQTIEVTLGYHKAIIEHIFPQPKLEPWYKEDMLVVWLRPIPPVDGLLSFAILVPVKDYTSEEFIKTVETIGSAKLGLTLSQMASEHEKHKAEDVQLKELSAYVDRLKEKLNITLESPI